MNQYVTVIGRPRSLPRIIQISITLIILLLPIGMLYYFYITDIARNPIDIKEESFRIPDEENDFYTISLGKLFLNTKIFLHAEKDQTSGVSVEILLLDKSSYDDILDGELSFFFDPEATIALQNDLSSAWNNVSVSTETSFYLIIREISSGSPVTVTISYWLEYPTMLERDLLAILIFVGGSYVVLLYGRRLFLTFRLNRTRISREKMREKEENEYYNKMKQERSQ